MKRRKSFFIFFFLFINFCAYSQTTFQKTFDRSLDDYATSVCQTYDGGYIIAGSTWLGVGDEYIYLIKTDSDGDTIWTKAFGQAGGIETVIQTSKQEYIVGSGTISYGAGAQDVLLTSVDNNGNISWSKTYGEMNADYAHTVLQTADGGFILSGLTKSFGAGEADICLIKTNSTGNTVWTKTYGGADFEIGESIQQTRDGGYIITGRTLSYGAGNFDVILIKIDAAGSTLWTKTYGGNDMDIGYFVLETDSGYMVCGVTKSFGAGLDDVFLIQTDTIGNLIWSKTYGGSSYDGSTCIQKTSDSGYIVSGYTKSSGAGMRDCYLIKINCNGDSLWTKAYGGSDDEGGYSVNQTADGGFIIAGYSFSFGTGSQDVYLIKTDSLGNSNCVYQYNTNSVVSSPTIIAAPQSILETSPGLISNFITPNKLHGATENILCISTNEDETTFRPIQNTAFEIVPNPAQDKALLQLNAHVNMHRVHVYDLSGKKMEVTLSNYSNDWYEMNLQQLPQGVYMIRVDDENIRGVARLVKL